VAVAGEVKWEMRFAIVPVTTVRVENARVVMERITGICNLVF